VAFGILAFTVSSARAFPPQPHELHHPTFPGSSDFRSFGQARQVSIRFWYASSSRGPCVTRLISALAQLAAFSRSDLWWTGLGFATGSLRSDTDTAVTGMILIWSHEPHRSSLAGVLPIRGCRHVPSLFQKQVM
jgi:hypothetical protein